MIMLHEVDPATGELLLRATPPTKAVRLDWIRGVHFELGRLLEQLEQLPTANTQKARSAFVIASRMLVTDLYVALRHAELELEPNELSEGIDLALPCARESCKHAFRDHQSPGAECTAIVGSTGGPLHCSCARFQSVLANGG
jgi:hypothetical protein